MSDFLRTDDPDLRRTVTIALQKGGTGKTTFAASCAYEAARLGARVALVDLDPNWGLTDVHLGVDPRVEQLKTVADLLAHHQDGSAASHLVGVPGPWQVRRDLSWSDGGALAAGGDLAFIPGFESLTGQVDQNISEPASEMRLRSALAGVAGSFDLVLIDTGPRADRIGWLALQASATVIGVALPEDGAVKGVDRQLQFVSGYAQAWRLPLRVGGVVCTKFDARNAKAHNRGVARLRTMLDERPSTPATEQTVMPAAGPVAPRSWTAGGVLWDEVLPQSTYLLHAQMDRNPIAYGLWPSAAATGNGIPPQQLRRWQQDRARAAVLPYTRAALRLLQLTDAPALPRIAQALSETPIAGLWSAEDEEN